MADKPGPPRDNPGRFMAGKVSGHAENTRPAVDLSGLSAEEYAAELAAARKLMEVQEKERAGTPAATAACRPAFAARLAWSDRRPLARPLPSPSRPLPLPLPVIREVNACWAGGQNRSRYVNTRGARWVISMRN